MADQFQPYDVSIPYAGLAERFEQWVRDQGWVLSDIVNVEGSDRPMRFVQPSFGPPPVPKQIDPRCPDCGHYKDTPNHHYACTTDDPEQQDGISYYEAKGWD